MGSRRCSSAISSAQPCSSRHASLQRYRAEGPMDGSNEAPVPFLTERMQRGLSWISP